MQVTLVSETDSEALVEESHLLEAGTQGFEIEINAFKDGGVGVEGLGSTGFFSGFTSGQRLGCLTAVIVFNMPFVALTAHFGLNAG